MNKFSLGLYGLALSLFLAGCITNGSPEGVVGSAGNAIMKGNLGDFIATLSPELAAKIGNLNSMAQLKAELSAYQSLRIRDGAARYPTRPFDGIYGLTVSGLDSKRGWVSVYELSVQCEVERRDPSDPSWITGPTDPGQDADPGLTDMSCLITAFQQA